MVHNQANQALPSPTSLLETRARKAAYVSTYLVLQMLIVLVAKSPAQPVFVVGVVFVLGCASIAAQACLYTIAPATYPFPIRGIGVGAAIAMGRVGSIVGPMPGEFTRASSVVANIHRSPGSCRVQQHGTSSG